MSILDVKDLSKRYKKDLAVNHINFQLKESAITILAGPNGAGKTTTIKCILGLLKKNSGEVLIDGKNIREMKENVAYVPENPDIYPYLTVWESMKFISLAYSLKQWEGKAKEILSMFNIFDKRNEIGKSLSKGMKQKLSICMALLHEPDIFLIDEPFVGLDPLGIKEFKQALKILRDNGKSVLISTHMLATVEELGDNIIIMQNGNILFNGSMKELRCKVEGNNMKLEDIFINMTDSAQENVDLK
ncbi:ABC transporter ATP-binding protein [Hathewaya histolytica]|uniref:ABC transporter ATP-binding protein n=1 Tax=Hathewaya histolytica TaxID=1498 RepID=A0A4U9QVG4_HATHI|nr:ABC transporter ATP-binding protein [Hathewaya histolytica]VTQ81801.1 ABC transporter ATP-binding protein [Hathewaya histolytica]